MELLTKQIVIKIALQLCVGRRTRKSNATAKRPNKKLKSIVQKWPKSSINIWVVLMGGVDLVDMLISLYRTPFKTRRGYIGIFDAATQLLHILCINNEWISYRNDCTKIRKGYLRPFKAFRHEIYEGLKKNRRAVIDPLDTKKKPQKAIQPVPVESSRFDNVSYFMTMTSQGRCRLALWLGKVRLSR